MNEHNKLVMANIISGVETGGQRYGYGRWDDYTRPYKNTSGEHTCTLGAFQFYGGEANELCNMIFKADKNLFRRLDTCSPSIESMLNKDWVGMRWNPSSSQAATLSALISTETGIKCQKELFAVKQLNAYEKRAIEYGVNDVKARMMWIEIQHLGGGNAPKRIFARCNGDYSVDNILDCLNPRYADYNRYNEPVEAKIFWTRHVCCATWIKQYAEDEGKTQTATKTYLTTGSSGEKVKELQSNLMLVGLCDCGYYSSPQRFIDGDFGDNTRKSVVALQEISDIETDGIYGEQSEKALTALVKSANESKFNLTVGEFLKNAKKVADFVREKNFKYGNAAFLPSVYYPHEKYVSCDRFVDMVLFESGLKNVGNRNVGSLELYLAANGCKKITNKSEVKAGDIIYFKGHVFILGEKRNNGLYERYDCGSNARIQGVQPFVENIDGFICAYRLPFKANVSNDDTKTRLVKSGQVHLNNYVGAGLSVDGDYGTDTRHAFIKALQKAVNRDYGYSMRTVLLENGEWNNSLEKVIKEHPVTIYTEQPNITLVLAIGLYINGIEPYGLTMSEKLINALKKYQKKNSLEVDGAAGVKTFKSLATIK